MALYIDRVDLSKFKEEKKKKAEKRYWSSFENNNKQKHRQSFSFCYDQG